jgi:excisionase family DNA binding protein
MHARDASVPAGTSESPRRCCRQGANSRCVTVAVAAETLDVGPMTMYRAINAGQFPAIKFRDRWLVPIEAIDALIQAALTTGAAIDITTWTPAWLASKRPAKPSDMEGGGQDAA